MNKDRFVGVPRFELGLNPPKGLVLAVALHPVNRAILAQDSPLRKTRKYPPGGQF